MILLILVITILNSIFFWLFLYQNKISKSLLEEAKSNYEEKLEETLRSNKIRYDKIDDMYEVLLKYKPS